MGTDSETLLHVAFNLTSIDPYAKEKLLADSGGLGEALEKTRKKSSLLECAKREIDSASANGFRILLRESSEYPPLLRNCFDAPFVLYVRGALRIERAVAIVGSRKADIYGLAAAESFARELSLRKIEVVSGLAYGIDAAAHKGAVKGDGITVGVLGSGLLRMYPKNHQALADEIVAKGGAVISEYPLEHSPEPATFPIRNRIIAGMTLGTLIVQAARRSGSLITARLASEYGRLVWVIPNRIGEPNSEGALDLIRDGASVVSSPNDIIEDISPIG